MSVEQIIVELDGRILKQWALLEKFIILFYGFFFKYKRIQFFFKLETFYCFLNFVLILCILSQQYLKFKEEDLNKTVNNELNELKIINSNNYILYVSSPISRKFQSIWEEFLTQLLNGSGIS